MRSFTATDGDNLVAGVCIDSGDRLLFSGHVPDYADDQFRVELRAALLSAGREFAAEYARLIVGALERAAKYLDPSRE